MDCPSKEGICYPSERGGEIRLFCFFDNPRFFGLTCEFSENNV